MGTNDFYVNRYGVKRGDQNRKLWQRCVFSLELFNVYSEVFQRELDKLPGFIISRCYHNNIFYADNTVLMEDSEGEFEVALGRLVDESMQKELTINCEKKVNGYE